MITGQLQVYAEYYLS